MRNMVGWWLLAVLVAGGLCSLGAWQLGRMHEKQAMLDAVQQVLDLRTPRPLAVAGDIARERDYDWAAGAGRFVDAPAVLLDNQQRDDRPGVRAYRVFQPSAPGAAPLLVELGWLPLPGDRKLPVVSRPPGELRLAGLLAPPPSHGILAAVAVPQSGGQVLATGLDAAGLRDQLHQPGLAPRVLKLDPAAPLGYARDLDVLPNTLPPERHLGYAVQWFALAAAVLVIALLLTFRKRKTNKATP
ncbi:SURF1 family protein [Luteimonas mephitis]|uniref:SURF1 family protein n=1 Tax=Luteimonas mephitis TaxID=83615 RepID=UPI0004118849|nr:SURF1 family protein [Luteimonas mephitis]